MIGGLLGYGAIKAIASLGPAARGIGQFIATNVLDKAVKKIPQSLAGILKKGSSDDTELSLEEALRKLEQSGLRPGQTEIRKSKINIIINSYDPIKAQSSIYTNETGRYVVEGHHTTIATTMLGKSAGVNMNLKTNDLPSVTNVHWSKKWYEFWKKKIKVVD